MNNTLINSSNIINQEKIKISNIYVVGYFDHWNTGDQQYFYTFDYLFNKYDIKNNTIYIDYDKIKNIEFNDDDVIILGGGDVLNHYFLDKIINKFNGKPNKIIAVSVGIPYKSILIDTNKIKIIDYIFLRTKQDIELLEKYFSKDKIYYLPDLSIYLPRLLRKFKNDNKSILDELERDYYNYKITYPNTNLNNNNEIIIPDNTTDTYYNNLLSIHDKFKNIRKKGKKIIGITLSRHIYSNANERSYFNIIDSLIKFIKYLLTFDFYIVFLPFNTNNLSSSENDIIIHNDLIQRLGNSKKILNITNYLESYDILDLYQYFYATIPMRFHAVLFSIYSNVPMLPIFTTRKIKNLLLDINWYHGYQLDCDGKDIPLYLDTEILIKRFGGIVLLRNVLLKKLKKINRDFSKNTINTVRFIDILTHSYKKIPFVLISDIKENNINELLQIVQDISKKYGYNDFKEIKETDIYTKNIVTKTVSYYLTSGRFDSQYNYGLMYKMFNLNYNYMDEWKWIINDVEKNKNKFHDNDFSNSRGLYNIKFINNNYINQNDYSGAHRSGWQYVYNHIKKYHNDNANIFLDLYLDRTFHWNKDINKELGIIPYKEKWIGFVHHTFNTTFSEYNNYNLINNKDFIESLKYCKGIFVLSKYLKNLFIEEFNKRNIFVPVYNLIHPTEINVKKFSWDNFLENNDKKLVNIGGWLRNVFSFYKLEIPDEIGNNTKCLLCLKNNKRKYNIKKIALKGKYMNNYYPNDDFQQKFYDFLSNLENRGCDNIISNKNISQNVCQNVCQNVSCNPSINSKNVVNNWNKHMYEWIDLKIKNMEFIENLNDNEYDNLLSENIVYINLVDASAVNTVIECIVRSTPIIVNKHPAIVELLGDKYPLFYENDYDVYKILSDKRIIKNGYKYLYNLDKSNLSIEFFIKNFHRYIINSIDI